MLTQIVSAHRQRQLVGVAYARSGEKHEEAFQEDRRPHRDNRQTRPCRATASEAFRLTPFRVKRRFAISAPSAARPSLLSTGGVLSAPAELLEPLLPLLLRLLSSGRAMCWCLGRHCTGQA